PRFLQRCSSCFDHEERPERCLSNWPIDLLRGLFVQTVLLHVAHDTNDCDPRGPIVKRKPFADWIFRTPPTSCGCIIHDRYSRRLVVISVGKHSPAEKRYTESAEVRRTDGAWIYLRRVVRLLRRTPFQLNRDVVWTSRYAGGVERIRGRHGCFHHAGLLTRVFE